MRADRFKPCVLTANDLLAGDVVYLAWNGTWTRSFRAARLFEDEEEANRRLADAERQEDAVIGPYLADALTGGGEGQGLRPAHFREVFRATGPTNYPHGKRTGS